MQQISFVILHYKVQEITEKCIDLLIKQNYDNYQIIIVDNFSDNGSAERLKDKYKGNKRIDIIFLERNYGFAKGNDIGYLIAKYKYGAEIIVVMNNDVLIEDMSFCMRLQDKYSHTDYGVIGPDIIGMNGNHQNPLTNYIRTYKQAQKIVFTQRIKSAILKITKPKKKKMRALTETNDKYYYSTSNVPLHGSCVIFTNKFIQNNEYAFFPDTFLYAEEEILYYQCLRRRIPTYYDSELKVLHLEDATANAIQGVYWKKRAFELDNSTKSIQHLIRLLKE